MGRASNRLLNSLSPDRRDLHNGFGNALGNAFELAATPAVFALVGWLLDKRLGTSPLFLVTFFLVTATYVGWKMLRSYDADMTRQEARFGRRDTIDRDGAR